MILFVLLKTEDRIYCLSRGCRRQIYDEIYAPICKFRIICTADVGNIEKILTSTTGENIHNLDY